MQSHLQRLPRPTGNRQALFYDVWSNIHYGYVGRAAGFSGTELHVAAKAGNIIGAGTNDPGDVLTIQMGIDLYEAYPPRKVTAATLANALYTGLADLKRATCYHVIAR